MMKTKLPIALFFLASSSFAQVTITHEDIIGSPHTVTQGVDFSTQMTAGSSGPNQVWDFTSVEEDSQFITNFVKPSNTPYGAKFPNAGLAIDEGADGYVYLVKTPSLFGITGIVQDVDDDGKLDVVSFKEPIIEAQLPMEYGKLYTDESVIFVSLKGDLATQGYDSAHFRQRITREVETDAFGTVKLPMGTFDAVRNRLEVDIVDSTWIFVAGQKQLVANSGEVQYGYEWYTNDDRANFQLVEMDYDANTGEVGDMLYLAKSPEIGVREIEQLQVAVYPNPTADFLTVDLGVNSSANVLIFDVQGKVLEKHQVNGTQLKIDVSAYKNGVYFYQVSEGVNKLSKGKFVVMH